MSDLSTEIKPIKNAYGLPTGELNRVAPLEIEEEEEIQEEEVEEEEEYEEEPEVEEEEEDEDILSYALDEPEKPKEASPESELDRLRRQVSVLEGRLEEQSRNLDRGIKKEAEDIEEDEDLDFSDPRFRAAIGEKLQDDPSLVPVLLQELVDRKLKAQAKKFEQMEAKSKESEVSIEQANRLKKNLYDGLSAAQGLGDLEKRIVEQVGEAVAARDPSKSVLLRYLADKPHLADSAEGIEGAVATLARRAEARAKKKGIDISTVTKVPASDRSNRMMEKQTKKTTEEDWNEQQVNRLLTKKQSPLDNLFKGSR